MTLRHIASNTSVSFASGGTAPPNGELELPDTGPELTRDGPEPTGGGLEPTGHGLGTTPALPGPTDVVPQNQGRSTRLIPRTTSVVRTPQVMGDGPLPARISNQRLHNFSRILLGFKRLITIPAP